MVIVIVSDLNFSLAIEIRRMAAGLRNIGNEVRVVAPSLHWLESYKNNDSINFDKDENQTNKKCRDNYSVPKKMIFGKYDKEIIKAVFSGADLVYYMSPFKLSRKAKILSDLMGIPSVGYFCLNNKSLFIKHHRKFYNSFDLILVPTIQLAEILKKNNYKAEINIVTKGVHEGFRKLNI